jgi:hypothetical protein
MSFLGYRLWPVSEVSVSWPSPAPIEEGTPLSSKQLNAVASINGEFVYNPAIGTVLHSGTDTLSLTFIPSDSRYRTVYRTVAIQVIAIQVIAKAK